MSSIRPVPATPTLHLRLRLAFASVALLWLALLAGMLGRYAWPLDLFAHFRVHYCVLFTSLGAALVLMERRWIAAAAFTGALVSAIPLAGYFTFPARSAAAQTESFSLVSLNIWFRNTDYPRIARYLRETGADVIVLQEAQNSAAFELRQLLASYPYAHIDPHWHGVTILSKWPLIAASSPLLAPGGAPAGNVRINWRGTQVTLLGVHLHWPLGSYNAQLRGQELEGVAAFARATDGPLIVAGDFNITPWSSLFQDAVARSGLRDCALGQGLASSWPSYASFAGIRIDQCLASPHFRVNHVRTGPHVGSDHRPLLVELSLRR